MNARNFDRMMTDQIQSLSGKAKLLLHCCCAPCASACLERLKDFFEITVLFYNPNIEDGEYTRRKDELVRFISETGWAEIMDCDHEAEAFCRAAAGLENEKEGGARCVKCFYLRLSKTAALAETHGFDFFTTTLTISPMKDAQKINAIGEKLSGDRAKWLYSDFKKRGGYLRSTILSKEHCLYRQNYCGCVYSQRERNLFEKKT